MKKIDKKLDSRLYSKYMVNLINKENGLNLNIRSYRRLMDTIEFGNKSLIEDGYSFKFAGMKYRVTEKLPKIFRDIHNGTICKSKAYLKLDVEVPRSFQKSLKEKTKRESNEISGSVGLSKEEFKKNKNNF